MIQMPGPPRKSVLFRSILLLVFCSDVSNVSGRTNTQHLSRDAVVANMADRDMHGYTDEPFFERMPGATGPQNVSALIGKTAFLTCTVRNLGKAKSVTWIRHRDVHILTVGEHTFTTDERFLARHNQNTDEWTLVIKYVQERDAGIYECQIPSSTPRAFPVNLNIVVPHVRIQGSPDLHVDQGSVINLTCIISYSPEPPAYVFWYRGKTVVAYDTEKSRVKVITETGRETRSHLVIRNAGPADSGNYTCKPSIARSASIKVHVLESEFPDALHESGGTSLHSLLRLPFPWRESLHIRCYSCSLSQILSVFILVSAHLCMYNFLPGCGGGILLNPLTTSHTNLSNKKNSRSILTQS